MRLIFVAYDENSKVTGLSRLRGDQQSLKQAARELEVSIIWGGDWKKPFVRWSARWNWTFRKTHDWRITESCGLGAEATYNQLNQNKAEALKQRWTRKWEASGEGSGGLQNGEEQASNLDDISIRDMGI